jgi:hypothetical protein
MTPTPRIVLPAIIAFVILGGSGLAQDKGGAAPQPRVEPPQTSGQASPPPAPTGHRQPSAKDVPEESNDVPVPPADRELDRRLNICRGC